jgi:UDP-GlcNAc:undecaprenyl-phosphate/decaprenyl-phosphate GlcNAc-1-phosphate transferase
MNYIIIAAILIIALPLYFKLAERLHIFDIPVERSSHSKPTIRGGGIIFPLAVLLWFVFFGFGNPLAIAGLLLIAAVSFTDDLLSLPNSLRFLVHLVAVSLLFVELGLFDMHWYLVVAAYVISIGWINAFNFMDGINAITPFYALVALASFWYASFSGFFIIPHSLIIVAAISLLIFSWYNARKHARTFAGDVGSISMAFILAWLMLALMIQTRNIAWILLFAVYGIDSVITIIIRLKRRENIFKAHRLHLYQLLANEHRWPHLKVASTYALFQLVINAITIFLITQNLMSIPVFASMLFLLSMAYLVIRRSLD